MYPPLPQTSLMGEAQSEKHIGNKRRGGGADGINVLNNSSHFTIFSYPALPVSLARKGIDNSRYMLHIRMATTIQAAIRVLAT